VVQSTLKTALITGSTGQDGAYLAEFLLAKGYVVRGLKRRADSPKPLPSIPTYPSRNRCAVAASMPQVPQRESERSHANLKVRGLNSVTSRPVGNASARFAADWAVNRSFHLGGGAGAKSAPQTGLHHISNRSQACRNGNWKMASRDWLDKATSPHLKFQNVPARDSGAPA
jgi:hypothetical protein